MADDIRVAKRLAELNARLVVVEARVPYSVYAEAGEHFARIEARLDSLEQAALAESASLDDAPSTYDRPVGLAGTSVGAPYEEVEQPTSDDGAAISQFADPAHLRSRAGIDPGAPDAVEMLAAADEIARLRSERTEMAGKYNFQCQAKVRAQRDMDNAHSDLEACKAERDVLDRAWKKCRDERAKEAEEGDLAKKELEACKAERDRLEKAQQCVSCGGSICPPMQCGPCIEREEPTGDMAARPATTTLRKRAEKAKAELEACKAENAALGCKPDVAPPTSDGADIVGRLIAMRWSTCAEVALARDARDEIERLRRHASNLQCTIDNLHEGEADLVSSLGKADNEIERLQAIMATEGTPEGEYDRNMLEQEVKRLRAELEECKAELTKCREDRDEARAELAACKAEPKPKPSGTSDDGEDIARWFRQNSTHEQSAYNLAADEIERLQVELSRIDHDRGVAIDAHMEECRKRDVMRDELEACKAELEECKSAPPPTSEGEREMTDISYLHSIATLTYNVFRREHILWAADEIERLRRHASNLQCTIDNLHEGEADLVSSMGKADDEIERLRDMVSEYGRRAEVYQRGRAEAQDEIERLRAENKRTKSMNKTLESQRKILIEELKPGNASLRAELEACKAELENVSAPSACDNAIDKIAEICGCSDWDYPGQVVRDVEQLRKELVGVREENQNLQANLCDVRTELAECLKDKKRALYKLYQATGDAAGGE